MTDVSVDLTANGFDASESFTLDRSIADDVVPLADPGIDRPTVSDAYATQIVTSAKLMTSSLHLLASVSSPLTMVLARLIPLTCGANPSCLLIQR